MLASSPVAPRARAACTFRATPLPTPCLTLQFHAVNPATPTRFPITIATRESRLALWQAEHVKALRDVLTPEQRARFDQFHQGGPMGMGKGRLGNRNRGMGWCNGSPIAPAAKP